MSGHSHWATHKRDKFANDAKRSQIFTKISRLIMVAAKQGGKDPDMNPSLRMAIEKAKEASMPKDNIERAILKGSGGGEGVSLDEVMYEGYAPEGVAVMVRVLTDNKNRTVSEIRNLFNKYGGSLGESGSAAYIFANDPEKPMYEVPVESPAAAKKVLDLLEALDNHDDVQDVYSNILVNEEAN